MKERVRETLKPEGKFSENAARMCQDVLQGGIPIDEVGEVIGITLRHTLGVDLEDLGISFDRDTVKSLSAAASKLGGGGGGQANKSAGGKGKRKMSGGGTSEERSDAE